MAKASTDFLRWVDPAHVHPNSWNPNRQSPKQFALLLTSIRQNEFRMPIFVHECPGRDTTQCRNIPKTVDVHYEIMDGEHRWKAFIERRKELTPEQIKRKKFHKLPVVISDTPPSESQLRAATLQFNRARGTEDIDLVAKILDEIKGWEVDLPDWGKDVGFSDADLKRISDDNSAAKALGAEDIYTVGWVPTGDIPYPGEYMTEKARAEAMAALKRKEQQTVDEQMIDARKPKSQRASSIPIKQIILYFTENEWERVQTWVGSNDMKDFTRKIITVIDGS